MRNLVAARRVSSGRSSVLSIVIAGVLVLGVFALLKVNSGAKQAPTEELLTGSIARSPAVRKSPSNELNGCFSFASAYDAIHAKHGGRLGGSSLAAPATKTAVTSRHA